MTQLIDLFIHLDRHLSSLIAWAGNGSYVLLFLIIFCETGLVITPFLPGDSFLFAGGAIAAIGGLNIYALLAIFFIAAVTGNEANYHIGKFSGKKLLDGAFNRMLDKRHVQKTERFFAKHGTRAIILSRFVPFVRTFMPFVAGMTQMEHREFATANMIGGGLWVGLLTLGGYLFGNITAVKQNFSWVVIAIIVISVIPPIAEWIMDKKD